MRRLPINAATRRLDRRAARCGIRNNLIEMEAPGMKIAVPTKDWITICGHAGQTPRWLVYDLKDQRAGAPLPSPSRIELVKEQLPHYFKDDGPHPLDGVEIILAGSAGDGYIRHMKKRGADVLLTGETDPAAAIDHLIKGEALPDQRFDITTSICRLRDLFSRH
jgi:predicted Fe-Mo cluster-binding NifX family protein